MGGRSDRNEKAESRFSFVQHALLFWVRVASNEARLRNLPPFFFRCAPKFRQERGAVQRIELVPRGPALSWFENSKLASPQLQAASLFMASARLYVLERTLGNERAAEIALVKVRYWNLRRYELRGPLTDVQLRELDSLTPDKIVEMIDHADKSLTQGKGSRYNAHEGRPQ